MSVYLQIDNDGNVVSAFASPQDPEIWPGVIEVDVGDQRYTDFTAAATPSVESIAIMEIDALLSAATLRMAPLIDAVDLGSATDDEVASLDLWREYRVALNRISGQHGYPEVIDWPVAPV
ncbi:tail fiber assembly protein [Pseudomonas plecoglossicida]|uniref:tail fiber assembly protein n=1 Tax=Pseudomonas plecoglossicida TaxID=70775 RepID=UPI003D1A08AF